MENFSNRKLQHLPALLWIRSGSTHQANTQIIVETDPDNIELSNVIKSDILMHSSLTHSKK